MLTLDYSQTHTQHVDIETYRAAIDNLKSAVTGFKACAVEQTQKRQAAVGHILAATNELITLKANTKSSDRLRKVMWLNFAKKCLEQLNEETL